MSRTAMRVSRNVAEGWSFEQKGGTVIVTVPQPFVLRFALLFGKFEGRKRIISGCTFSFEPTGANLALVVERYPETAEALQSLRQPSQIASVDGIDFAFRIPPSDWQKEFYSKIDGKQVFALFAEPGAGKTKAAIDVAFMRYAAGEIDAVLVIAKKDVHQQWVRDSLPEHAPENLPWIAYCHDWQSKTGWKNGCLNWLSVNFDAVRGQKAQAIINSFIANARSIMLIIDESQEIKNKTSQRWQACYKLRRKCRAAIIMSGTPIAKDLTDYWAQYFMLDERIIGDRYMTSFRAKYCVMGGYDGKQIVDYQNEAQLFKLTEPYTYRVSKKDLKMPPKRYKQVAFDMTPRQRAVFDKIKKQFVADLSNPNSSTMQNIGNALLRMQQITCGFLPNDDGTVELFDNPRLDTLLATTSGLDDDKLIIWCRFQRDVQNIMAALGEAAVDYYGGTPDEMTRQNLMRFLGDKDCRYFVATPAKGGTGIDGLQRVCSTAIYYSNSFNSIHRWQSEDRINRTGMAFTSSLYIDLICRAGVDRGLLRNLREKRDLSTLMLDDLRDYFSDKA